MQHDAIQLLCNLIESGYKVQKDLFYENSNTIYYAEKNKTRLQIQNIWDGQFGLFIGEVTSFGNRGKWINKPVPSTQYNIK